MSERDHPKGPLDDLGDISPEEAAEAAEYVRLLDGRSNVHLSQDALEGAGLLRVMKQGELSPEVSARIELEVLETVPQRVEPAAVRPWWWLVLAALAPAAAAGLFLLTSAPERGAAVVAVAPELPLPPVSVLEAQASWITADAERPRFEREMREYRSRVLAAAATY